MKNIYQLIIAFGLVLSFLNTHAQTAGCDYNLSVSDVACWTGTYTFPDGTVITNIISQVVHTSNLQTVQTSCDSIITTTVNPLPYNYRSEDLYGICPGEIYTFADGTIDTIWAHTEYTSYLQTVHTGCDSIVETILNTTDISNSVVMAGNELTAVQGNASWLWVDCDNGHAVIDGEISQTFAAPVGNFAVVIHKGSCVDTSACYQVLTVGMSKTDLEQVIIYPNPTTAAVNVNLAAMQAQLTVSIKNAVGQQLNVQHLTNVKSFVTNIATENGIYFMELRGTDGLHATYKIVRE